MTRLHCAIILCAAAAMLAVGVSPSLAAPGYEQGIKAAKAAIASGDHGAADSLLASLAAKYPGNPEILAMRGRVLFWRKKYDEACAAFTKAIKRDRSPNLKKELRRAESFRDISAAEKLLAGGKTAEGEALLRKVYERGEVRYESGILLARSTFERGAFPEAAAIHRDMIARYPEEKDLRSRYAQSLAGSGREGEALVYVDSIPAAALDAELLAVKARIRYRGGDFPGAAALFRSSLELQDSADVAAELKKAENAADMSRADELVLSGRTDEASAFLIPLCERQDLQYEACRKLAGLAARSGNHAAGASLYGRLAAAYPAEPDFRLLEAQELLHLQKTSEAAAALDAYPDQSSGALLSLRGRMAMLSKNYEEAVSFYERSFQASRDPEDGKRLNEARTSRDLAVAGRLMAEGDYVRAEELLSEISAHGTDPYSAGLMLGRVLLARKEYHRAALHYEELERRYPKEPDLAAQHIESHILAREYAEAVEALTVVKQETQAYIAAEREDLLFRSAANWARVSGGAYGYSGRAETTETGISAAVSQRFGKNTVTASATFTTKFGLTDSQYGIDFSRGKGEKSPFWWNLHAAVSPEARILPRTTAGAELTRGFDGYEASFGFTRMDFRKSGVNIFIPGVIWYIPGTAFSLSERFYLVPETGGFTSLTTLNHEPDHRFRWFAALGAGTSTEQISSREDAERFATLSGRLGAEYRFTPSFSIGAELSWETRQGLYDRNGGLAFMRYWWR